MKKRYILIILIVFGLMFWALTRAVPTSAPVVSQPESPADGVAIAPAGKPDVITVTTPLPESTVSSPILIKGTARGNWFFEASAPVTIVNWDGLIIGQGIITVDDGYSWMTTDFVPFTGSISYDASQLGAYKYGSIILKKDNASGEPQFDDSLEFKILFP